jgi:hypothetical protein
MAVVQAHLQVPVVQHDDQSLAGMYDLKIEYPDGRVGAVEVTAAGDQDLAARQGALAGRRALLKDHRLAHGWLVVLCDSAQVNVARARLPTLRLRLEAVGLQEASVFSTGGLDEEEEHAWLPTYLARSQVQTAKTTGGPAGTVIMTGPMRVGFLSQDPDDVVTFVEEFVASRPSDVAKLGRAGTAERHLFIWGGVFSTGWVPLRALELDEPQLPLRAPQLPGEVTHVWVAPEATPSARIVVWSATTDWVQVATIRPAS